jgi:hypothetical protein
MTFFQRSEEKRTRPVKVAGSTRVDSDMTTKTVTILTIDEAAERMDIAGGKTNTRGRLYGRLIALGYGEECSRCGGDGRWFGGVCWRCGGARHTVPAKALSEDTIAEARRRQDAGELAEYFAAAWARKHPDFGWTVKGIFTALQAFVTARGSRLAT